MNDTQTMIDLLHETTRLLQQIQECEPELDAETILVLRAAETVAKEARNTVAHCKSYAMTAAEQAGDDGITYANLRAYVKPEAAAKTTDWPLGLPKILGRIETHESRIDKDTGEIEPLEDTYCRLLPTVLRMTGSIHPKVQGMKDLGFDDPYEFSEVGEWRKRLVVEETGEDSEAAA